MAYLGYEAPPEGPESRLEAIAQAEYPHATEFSSFMDYHIFSMKAAVEAEWCLLEYTILCILVHRKGHRCKDVYKFLKAYPWTKDTYIAQCLSLFELEYSWYSLILPGEAEPRMEGSPHDLLATVDEGQIHRLNTQFRYWQAAGERSWIEHFVDMSPHMWFGPQGQERQGRLGIPGFADMEDED